MNAIETTIADQLQIAITQHGIVTKENESLRITAAHFLQARYLSSSHTKNSINAMYWRKLNSPN